MPQLSRLTRIALLILGVVIVALTIYTYPSLGGFITLLVRAIVILGALSILVVLGASLFNAKPRGFPIVVLLTAVGVIAFSFNQIMATRDYRTFRAEIDAAGPDALFRTIQASRTETAQHVRDVYFIATQTDQAIDVKLSPGGGGATPGIGSVFATPLVTDPATLAAARAAIPELRAAAAAASAEITRYLDEEVVLISPQVEDENGRMPELIVPQLALSPVDTTGLPDSARLLFVDAVLRRIEAQRPLYEELAVIAVARIDVQDRMLAYLEARAGAYTFDEAAARARFADPAADAGYTALLDELAALDAADLRVHDEHNQLMTAAATELIAAAGATP
ncbi:MAG: hypothetical protein IT534_12640 [Bauldia sp.]|nr:hypothetical protein [Bauldia sp.]